MYMILTLNNLCHHAEDLLSFVFGISGLVLCVDIRRYSRCGILVWKTGFEVVVSESRHYNIPNQKSPDSKLHTTTPQLIV